MAPSITQNMTPFLQSVLEPSVKCRLLSPFPSRYQKMNRLFQNHTVSKKQVDSQIFKRQSPGMSHWQGVEGSKCRNETSIAPQCAGSQCLWRISIQGIVSAVLFAPFENCFKHWAILHSMTPPGRSYSNPGTWSTRLI